MLPPHAPGQLWSGRGRHARRAGRGACGDRRRDRRRPRWRRVGRPDRGPRRDRQVSSCARRPRARRGAGMRVLHGAARSSSASSRSVSCASCLEPVVRRDVDRERLLQGAAKLAEPVLLGAPEGVDAAPLGLLHGVHWLVANLADETPLAVVVDDAHWADEPSLRFLAYLGRRVESLRIALLVGARPDDDPSGLLAEIRAHVGRNRLDPQPLSPDAVAALLDERRGPRPRGPRVRARLPCGHGRQPVPARGARAHAGRRRRPVHRRRGRACRRRRALDRGGRRRRDARADRTAAGVAGARGGGARRRHGARPGRRARRPAGRRRGGGRGAARARGARAGRARASLPPSDPRRRGVLDVVGPRAGRRPCDGRDAPARQRRGTGARRAAAAAHLAGR